MARDRAIGAALVAGAVIGVIVYGSLMFLLGNIVALLVLELTAFVAVLAILGILGWIGYVMATTPPPVPMEPTESQGAAASHTTAQSSKQ